MQNSDFSTGIASLFGPSPLLCFLHAKQWLLDQNYKSPRVSDPTCRFCMQNSVISARITSLYAPQTSPMVFCIQNCDFSTGIASLYGSQPSSVVFACKTATLGPELQVTMGPRPHLRFFAFKTAALAPELQVSMGPSPHLWFLHAKQRLLDQNYKSPTVPDPTCCFCMQNSVISTRITSLHGSQS